ncbi:MAG: hypothetical protein E7309_05060 [Butyrivibrio sp.]|jgi:hypothetical protein|nr:hypothetical protein [Butyrivibrio sp.]
MDNKKENSNQNNFNGITNFNGSVQFAVGNIYNGTRLEEEKNANYTPEPLWRSPFTLAVLTWISVFIGIIGVIPIGKIIKNALNVLNGNFQVDANLDVQRYLLFFAGVVILFVLVISLRRIAKKEIRIPLILNLAINGYGKRITIEKIQAGKCPKCGGEMKYYNKPVEWRDIIYSDGRIKREITKRIPVLECKRNKEHFYLVDPAESKIQ